MTDPSIASPPGIGSSSNSASTPSLTTHGRSVSHGTPSVSDEQDEKGLHGYDKSTSYPRVRKRDKFFKIFRSAKPVVQLNTQPLRPETKNHHNQSTSTGAKGDDSNGASSVRITNPRPETLSTAEKAKAFSNVFSKNVVRPASKIALPKLHARIDNTHQLALCGGLLKHPVLSPPNETGLEYDPDQTKESTQDAATDDAHRDWAKAMVQNPLELDHICWLLARMVQEFIDAAVKGREVITEIVLLGPVLDRVHYRKLLSCFILEFEKSPILDEDLLYGLVQLVQCASEGYLESGDLIKILSVLKIRLQQTHQHSISHQYYLTLAVSRVLDVMAKQEVKDLDRVELSEALGALLSSMRENSDPFLTYQASYAFQALQCVPINETVLQAVMRHSGAVAQSLIYISGVVNLNLSAFLDGLGQLHKTLTETIAITKSAIEGAQSLIANGQDVFEAIKNGIRSGRQRSWYTAIVGAGALVQEGRLDDFKAVVFEAVCRQSPEFQWGICQLLGEIAMDFTWESTTRQEAVDFLVMLYTNDPDWGQDTNVKMWMLTILRLVSVGSAITVPALLRQDIDEAEAVKFSKPYPLRCRLPLPVKSALLAQVQEIPYVKRDVYRLMEDRVDHYKQRVYIQPQAKTSIQVSDDGTVPLMDMVKAFLDSDQQVFLVLGDSGAGKSTFAKHLEQELWNEYNKQGGPIPLFIDLPNINDPHQGMIDKQLQGFSEAVVKELKEQHRIILICDGYDEAQLQCNLHTTNMLGEKRHINIKMIISCRSTYLPTDYHAKFQPRQSDKYSTTAHTLFSQAVIVPFSRVQIEDYVNQFVQDSEVHKLTGNGLFWSAKDYMDKLESIPDLMALVKNPFLLTLSLVALPSLVMDGALPAKTTLTRLTLYDSFMDQWLNFNCPRRDISRLSETDQKALEELEEEGFTSHAIEFLKDLAAAIFREQDGKPVVEFRPITNRDPWKVKFFGPEPHSRLVRKSSPLSRAGTKHQFLHRSLLEYFYARHIYETNQTDLVCDVSRDLAVHTLNQRTLIKEPSVVQFLAEYVQGDCVFKQGLYQLLELSKTDADVSQAAANAITILVQAGVRFSGQDLRGIRVPGSNLSFGVFDSAELQEADLQDACLQGTWLRQADLSGARLHGAWFGEWPALSDEKMVGAFAYSPDRSTFLASTELGSIQVYNTSTWSVSDPLEGHVQPVRYFKFSPDGAMVATGGDDSAIRLWDLTAKRCLHTMDGHEGVISGLAFAPCGKQLASCSKDNKVRLWVVQTGVLENLIRVPDECAEQDWDEDMYCDPDHYPWHEETGLSDVAYSPDGLVLATCFLHQSLGLWSVETKKCLRVLKDDSQAVNGMAFSIDGTRISSSGFNGSIVTWDTATGDRLSIWEPEVFGRTWSMTYSPNGQQLACAGEDGMISLLYPEAGPSGHRSLRGHVGNVYDIVYSFDGSRIATAGEDKTIRLWDAHNGTPGPVLKGHSEAVERITFSPNGSQIASGGGRDKIIRLWDIQPSIMLHQQYQFNSRHIRAVRKVLFLPGGRYIASQSEDTVCIWDRYTGKLCHPLDTPEDTMTLEDISPCGLEVATVVADSRSQDYCLQLWNTQTGVSEMTLPIEEFLCQVAYSPDGLRMAFAYSLGEGYVRIWNRRTAQFEKSLSASDDDGDLIKMLFSPNQGCQLAVARNGMISLWDMATYRPQSHRLKVPSVHTIMTYSQDGTVLWTCSTGAGIIHSWDTARGSCITTITIGSVIPKAFSRDGSRLIALIQMEGHSKVAAYSVMSGGLLCMLGDATAETLVDLSADGQMLATCSDDNIVRVWDLSSSCQVAEIMKFDGNAKVSALCWDKTATPTSTAHTQEGGKKRGGLDLIVGRTDGDIGVWKLLRVDGSEHRSSSSLSVNQYCVKKTETKVKTVQESTRGELASNIRKQDIRMSIVKGKDEGEEGTIYRLTSQWTSASGKLSAQEASIQDVEGLSEANARLLKQNGAKGNPAMPLGF